MEVHTLLKQGSCTCTCVSVSVCVGLHLRLNNHSQACFMAVQKGSLMMAALKGIHKKKHTHINRGVTVNCNNKDNGSGERRKRRMRRVDE